MKRRAGVLLHPTSLAGPYGIGDIGPAARDWLAWLDAAGQRVWQILPLTPVDYAGSPYASASAFAHEGLLLSIDDLIADGWLGHRDKPYASRGARVNWPEVREKKGRALIVAADRVRAQVDLRTWASAHPELANWALYQALAADHGGSWTRWPEPLRERDASALAEAEARVLPAVERELALQWLFDQQWGRLRADATARGIEIWGDVPFFVSLDCADVWAAPHRWRLGPDRRPAVVSGVPPDAFSEDGQLWGHPHYAEDVHRAEGYAWWKARFARALSGADRVRIDHFRGFESVWEVAADAPDAREGRWIPGPGAPLLEALAAEFPTDPFVAEDLGIITDDVRALRDQFGLPGMAVLQFAFSGDVLDRGRHHNLYLPHQHRPRQVCFTGTHDNDTTLGWYGALDAGTREHVRTYLGASEDEMPRALMRAAWRSVADSAIVPMQDVLGLGSEARTNVPGVDGGNWSWRMADGALRLGLAEWLCLEATLSGRVP